MNYLAQAKITEDNYIIIRVKSAVAAKLPGDPHFWTMKNIWALAAQPGWGEAYGRVLDGEVITDPAAWAGTAGADPTVITDQMISDAVDTILAQEAAGRAAALAQEQNDN